MLIDNDKKCYNRFDLCVCNNRNIIIHFKSGNWVCYNCSKFGYLVLNKDCGTLRCSCKYHIINSNLQFIQDYIKEYRQDEEDRKRKAVEDWIKNNDVD